MKRQDVKRQTLNDIRRSVLRFSSDDFSTLSILEPVPEPVPLVVLRKIVV